ncbi:MAG: hypothetical protein ACI90U_001710 [Pseudomonadales bacterium]|jgi:hypothetical protein
MPQLLLYTTLGCHLCDDALAIAQPTLDKKGWEVSLVEIADSPELVDKYGIRIPVLARVDNRDEIGWPFGVEQIEELLG